MSNFAKLMQQAAAGAGGDSYWIALLGGTSNDYGKGVTVDSSDNIIAVGQTYSDGAGNYDFITAKYDSSGVLQWDRTLGSVFVNSATHVAIDSSNNIIVVGYSRTGSLSSTSDFVIAKYNSSGTLQWQRTLKGSSYETSVYVDVDSSDNIIICGRTQSVGAGNYDFITAKYNSSGTLQWQRTLGGSSSDSGIGVAIDSSDNIIVVGTTSSDGAGSYDVLIAKYDSSGVLQWDRTLGGTGSDLANAVAIDSSDNIIICGQTSSDGAGSSDALIAKFNSSGTLQWDRTLGGTSGDYGNGVAIDSSDNIIAVGQTRYNCVIAKYNSSGTLQWDKELGGTDSSTDALAGVAVDSSDNIIICGFVKTDGAGGADMLVAKLPSDGSGDGTYGSLIYQDANLTDAEAVLTDADAVLTDSAASLTDTTVSLTDAAAVLTEELFEITL